MAQRAKAPCFVHSFFGLGPTSLTSLTGICLPDIWLRHCQLPSLSHSSFRTCWDWALFSLCHQLLSVPLTLSSWLCPRPGGILPLSHLCGAIQVPKKVRSLGASSGCGTMDWADSHFPVRQNPLCTTTLSQIPSVLFHCCAAKFACINYCIIQKNV